MQCQTDCERSECVFVFLPEHAHCLPRAKRETARHLFGRLCWYKELLVVPIYTCEGASGEEWKLDDVDVDVAQMFVRGIQRRVSLDALEKLLAHVGSRLDKLLAHVGSRGK